MPHIVLEYSSNLYDLPSFSKLFEDIHQVLHREGGIKLENCKSRARAAHHFYIGDGHPANAFVHCNIEFVAGRSLEIKQAIGEACLELIRRYYEVQLNDRFQITVKIDDIEFDYYFKHPEGTLHY